MDSEWTREGSSSTPGWNHDVFLSFSDGESTRLNFIDGLYIALIQRGMNTFRNDCEFRIGEDLDSEILKVIKKSRISIVVFSRRYAFSRWCLDDLVKIIECKKTTGQTVLPVYFNVDPSDLRTQSGIVGKAFDEHEVRFMGQIERVRRWRMALDEATHLPGWNLRNWGDQLEVIRNAVLSAFTMGRRSSPVHHRASNSWYHDTHPECCIHVRCTLESWTTANWRTPRPFDIFINHRGVDTKRSIAALLYDSFVRLYLHPFLDYRSLKPGEKLDKLIETAMQECKVVVAIFSPNYCGSDNCLRELAVMMECEKKIIPIFYDVNPCDLALVGDGSFPAKQLHRFRSALELAKGTVGILFDSCKGDWSDLVKIVSDRVVEILMELEVEKNLPATIETYFRENIRQKTIETDLSRELGSSPHLPL